MVVDTFLTIIWANGSATYTLAVYTGGRDTSAVVPGPVGGLISSEGV
jgi:hypothetical protein